jgi:Uma2 family endonuclease
MTRSAAMVTRPPRSNPWLYGYRFVKKIRRDGTMDLVQVPLTLEDVLHPQEDDHISDRPRQNLDAEYLGPIFRSRVQRLPGGLVLLDCLLNWGVPGIRNHSPDISVFNGLTNHPGLDIGTFRPRNFGGRCILAMEIVSPHTRVNDVVHKFREYHQVRVPRYVIIDQESEGAPREVIGYRWTPSCYVRMRLDRRGRLLLRPLRLWLGLEDELAACWDADTGERLGGYTQIDEARRVEHEARLAAEQRIRDLEAELRRAHGLN